MDTIDYNVSHLRMLDDTKAIANGSGSYHYSSRSASHNPNGKASAKSNLHRQGVVESGSGIKSIHPRLGHNHQLQPNLLHNDNEHNSPEPILQHLILLRREVRELTERIKRLESSGKVLAKGSNRKPSRQLNKPSGPMKVLLSLSLRQRKVFLLIAEGACVKDIAFKLDISLKTVEGHWANIRRALNISSYVDACKLAYSTGLLTL